MISLSDRQLDIVTHTAGLLPVEKRGDYLQRVAAHLQIRCGRFTDRDVSAACATALASLVQHPSAA
jgi:hypothetical protein